MSDQNSVAFTRVRSDIKPNAELAELRRIVDLQERAQRLGKTGYVISDLTADRVYWSQSLFEQRKVAPRPYFTRAEALSFIHPDDIGRYNAARDKALAGKHDFDIEMRIVCGDGTEIWERCMLRPEFDAAGTCTGLMSVVHDVTDRKRAQLAMTEAHDRFAGAFQSSVDAMLVAQVGPTPGSGIIVDANEAVFTVFRRTPAELIGRPIGELVGSLGNASVNAVREKLLAGQVVRGLPLRIERADGSVADLELSGSIYTLGGETLALVILRDQTDRIEAENRIRELNESLEASLRQLRAIADHLPVAISYQDDAGALRFVNRTLEQWFAAGPGALIGKRVAEFVAPDYLASLKPVGRRRDAGELRSEATVAYPDGRTRTIEVSFIPDTRKDGTLAGWYTLAIDLSDRKAAEEQLHQSERLQSIGKLTGGVAHDFNNLLGVISGNIELAHERLRRRNDRDIAKLLEPAQRAVERGSTLTKSLLSFARQQPLSPQVIDMSTLVTDMVRLLRRTLPANIAVHTEGFSGPVRCEVDPGQLQNALLNLVVNARDAMARGGSLAIEQQTARIARDDASNAELSPGEYVVLSVSDTGTGMTADTISRAFEPFFTTKPTGEGTGLGLSTVYGFAKQSGGNVTLESAPGAGTTVRIFLPKWSGATTNEQPAGVPAGEAACAGKVLVVEDDEDLRFITVTMLKSLGYQVVEASDGRAALGTLANEPSVALIVTDVMLAGGLNGRNVAEAAKSLKPDIKTLFMSGYSENAILHEGRLDPDLHFIQKPFRKQELAQKVRQALDD